MTSPLFFTCIKQTHSGQRETLCKLNNNRATAVALFVLGVCMIGVGAFLMFGGIGTIPASLGGFSFILAGLASMAASAIYYYKK